MMVLSIQSSVEHDNWSLFSFDWMSVCSTNHHSIKRSLQIGLLITKEDKFQKMYKNVASWKSQIVHISSS